MTLFGKVTLAIMLLAVLAAIPLLALADDHVDDAFEHLDAARSALDRDDYRAANEANFAARRELDAANRYLIPASGLSGLILGIGISRLLDMMSRRMEKRDAAP